MNLGFSCHGTSIDYGTSGNNFNFTSILAHVSSTSILISIKVLKSLNYTSSYSFYKNISVLV